MEEWKKVSLREVTDIIGDGLHGTPLYSSDGEFAFVNGNNLSDGAVEIKADTKMCDLSEYEKYKKDLSDRTLFLSINGTIGNTAKYNGEKIILGKSACYLNVKKDYNLDFIYYVLRTPAFQSAISGLATGTTIKNVSLKTIREYEFYVPDYEGQTRIARILRVIDDKVELNNRINHNLEEQAQIVFDRIFNSDLTNNCLLSSIVDINPKRTLRKNEVARCIDMTYLNTAGSFPSGWEFKPYSGGMKFINGDTLMARITPCLENGKVAYINFLDKEETAFGSTEYIVFHAKEGYPNEMFYFLTRNKAFIEFATKNMNGSSGRQRVSGETIGNYIIPVLSEDDISELKAVSESTMKEILKNNLESRVLSEMRNTILPRLMSGELKINDLTC